MIMVTHAYSRHNSGDGLLVDLTLERLVAAGFHSQDVVLAAMDPSSFGDFPRVIKVGTAGRSADPETAQAVVRGASTVMGALTPVLTFGKTACMFRDADAFVAVGGGYLRAGTRTNRWGTTINHMPQLEAAARSGRPSVYLPQSVGPLIGWQGRRIRACLHHMSAVHLRDDRSIADVGPGMGIERTPDLAVLALADTGTPAARDITGIPILVARSLGSAPDYQRSLVRLAQLLGGPRWGVQAEGAATKSDATFYTDVLHVEPSQRVEALVRGSEPGVVVSVRLHGALQSLMAGVPAIHLGYERKSWAAFADLGLAEWVHSARQFDPYQVANQVSELQRDASRYWQMVSEALPRLRRDSNRLSESLATNLSR